MVSLRHAKQKLLAIASLVILALLTYTSLAYAEQTCPFEFVILGSWGCPHCRATYATLIKLYPECVRFYEVGVNETATRLYKGLYDVIFPRLPYGVPFILVLKDNKPIVFILGERSDPNWWKSLVANLTKSPPHTGLRCLGPMCEPLPEDVYHKALSVYKAGGLIVKIAACYNLTKAVVEGIFGNYIEKKLPRNLLKEALGLLGVKNATLRSYILVCGKRCVLAMIDKNVPSMIVRANYTQNIDFQLLSIVYTLAMKDVVSSKFKAIIVYYGLNKTANAVYMLFRGLTEKDELTSKLVEYCREAIQKPLWAVIAGLVGLAALDSVNPCFLALYTALIATAASIGAVLSAGLAVSLGVFAGYYLLGLGIVTVLAFFGRQLRLVLAALMLLLAARTAAGLRGGSNPEECKVCKLLLKGGGRVSILALFGFGLLASWTLLPCTAGPYVVAATLIKEYGFWTRLALLAVYNLVFIAPLLAVMMGAAWIASKYEKAVKPAQAIATAILVCFAIILLLEEMGLLPPII